MITGLTTSNGAGGEVVAFPGGFKDVYSAIIQHAPRPQRPFYDLAYKQEELQRVKGNRVIFTKMRPLMGIPEPMLESELLSSHNISSEQYWVDVKEYGYKTTFTNTAQVLNNLADISSESVLALGDMYQKTVNKICRDAALNNGNVLYPNGKALGTLVEGTDSINTSLLMNARKLLKANAAPMFLVNTDFGVREAYVCVAHPDQLASLHNDPAFEAAANYHRTTTPFTGEIGMWRGIVFVETPTMPCGVDSYDPDETYDPALKGVGAAGADVYKSIVLGREAFAFAATGPVELRIDPPRDLGRFYDMGWLRYMGANILDQKYAVNLLTA